MAVSRMPRYNITNDGMGPYAVFYCDRCSREYRSNPSIGTTVKESVARGAFGGLLRNIPIVGDSAANQVENDRYRTHMSNEELASAWSQTSQYFRECPTCHQIVCIPDFDETTGYCDDDSPRKAEIEAAKVQQAAVAMKGIADVFGVSGAIQGSMAASAAAAQAQAGAAPAGPPAGMPPAQQQAAAAAAMAAAAAAMATPPCVKCGAALAPGTKFCANCGTAVAQPSACTNCGTALAPGAKFCPNCGTAAAGA